MVASGVYFIQLEFENNAVTAIAQEAYRRKTGARALRVIVEELMLELMPKSSKHD